MTPHRKELLLLIAAFILSVVVGTLSHEMGHYGMGLLLGLRPSMGYAYTVPGVESLSDRQWRLFLLGGPLLTFISGGVGLALLLRSRATFRAATRLSPRQWSLVFLALFLMRPAVNLGTWLLGYFLNGRFSEDGDEVQLAAALRWPEGSLVVATALVSIAIFCLIFFRFIPKSVRGTFLLAGALGGAAGYIGWMGYLGPLLLP